MSDGDSFAEEIAAAAAPTFSGEELAAAAAPGPEALAEDLEEAFFPTRKTVEKLTLATAGLESRLILPDPERLMPAIALEDAFIESFKTVISPPLITPVAALLADLTFPVQPMEGIDVGIPNESVSSESSPPPTVIESPRGVEVSYGTPAINRNSRNTETSPAETPVKPEPKTNWLIARETISEYPAIASLPIAVLGCAAVQSNVLDPSLIDVLWQIVVFYTASYASLSAIDGASELVK